MSHLEPLVCAICGSPAKVRLFIDDDRPADEYCNGHGNSRLAQLKEDEKEAREYLARLRKHRSRND